MARIGVFICHCGENIARTVDVLRVAEWAARLPGVAHATEYRYMCSDPGQRLMQGAIREKGLTGVVVAACSPHMHEATFRRACQEAGLNPFLCEIANIREHCSWVHDDRGAATQKACELLHFAIEKVKRNHPLAPIRVPITRRALVIGGGIAGIQAALDIAHSGFQVTLVERQASIGGNMARLSETFPSLDCSQCILTPRMVEVRQHPNIELLTCSEVEEISGYVGNFQVRIARRPRYVVEDLCTGCGDCAPVCPVAVPSEFDGGLSWRAAVSIPFPQAVPSIYAIDEQSCLNGAGMFPLVCERCAQACDARAINYDMKTEILEREVGAVVLATGYQLFPAEQAREYGYGKHPDVMNGLEFERLLSASGPTGGQVRRPSDGRVPREVVFIQCVGSRDPEHGVPYCSKICCMYTAKQAMLYKHKVHDGQAYVFYMDIRAGGKGYEEFVRRTMEEDRILYIRGRVAKTFAENGKLVVAGVDTLSGQRVEVAADLVVLATAMTANGGLAHTLRVTADEHGFYQEAHPKLRPVETLTAGVYVAGASQGPKDIPETVSQAGAAASKALTLLTRQELEREPTVAHANPATCVGCFDCRRVCPFGAVESREMRDRQGRLLKVVSQVNEGVCAGCGACVVACRNGSMDLAGFSEEQLFAEIAAITT